MLREKLEAYIGFAKRKRVLFQGRALDEKLIQNKIDLVVILPACSLKRREHIERFLPKEKIVTLGEGIDLKKAFDSKLVSAFGIADTSLATAIKQEVERRTIDEQRKEEK